MRWHAIIREIGVRQIQEEGLPITGHVASDRILLSYLTGIDCESVGLTGMDDILYLAGPSPTVAEHAHSDGKG